MAYFTCERGVVWSSIARSNISREGATIVLMRWLRRDGAALRER